MVVRVSGCVAYAAAPLLWSSSVKQSSDRGNGPFRNVLTFRLARIASDRRKCTGLVKFFKLQLFSSPSQLNHGFDAWFSRRGCTVARL